MYAGSMPDAYILRTENKLSGIKSFVNTEIGWFFLIETVISWF